MRLHRALVGPLAAVGALALAACGSSGQAAPGRGGPTIVASTNVYGSIARAVAGDRATVTSLISDPSADPHSYESTPADALAVGRAGIVVLNGGGYDAFMPRLVAATGGQHRVLDVAGLSGLEDPATAADADAGHDHAGFNEHLWYSLGTVRKLADRLAAELGAVDPGHAAAYRADAQRFGARIDELATKLDTLAATHRGAQVVVTEPLPGYLVAQAGLADATPTEFVQAVEDDTDPPAAVVARTLALFDEPGRVHALVVNAQTRTAATDQVRRAAEAAGVPVVEMTETLPAGADDYLAWMGSQVDALVAAVDTGSTR